MVGSSQQSSDWGRPEVWLRAILIIYFSRLLHLLNGYQQTACSWGGVPLCRILQQLLTGVLHVLPDACY